VTFFEYFCNYNYSQ